MVPLFGSFCLLHHPLSADHLTSSLGRKGLWNVSHKLCIGLETCRDDKNMNKIVLIELVTLSPLTGDWPVRLRVWPPHLCSKSSKWTCPGDALLSTREVELPALRGDRECPGQVWATFLGVPLLHLLPGIALLQHRPVWSHVLLTGLISCPWTLPRRGHLHTQGLSLTLVLGILNLSKARFPADGSGYRFCGFTDSKCWNKHNPQQTGELQYFH